MLKLSEAMKEVLDRNPLLQFGLSHQLFNLSQLAKYLAPQVSARIEKQVQPSALLMALSRYQRTENESRTGSGAPPEFVLKKLAVNSGLVISTFSKTPEVRRDVNEFYRRVQAADGFFTISEGVAQITTIFEEEFLPLRKKLLRRAVLREYDHVGSLAVRFDEKYLDIPGFLYFVLQQFYLQNINILELTSTATELVVFLAEEDVRLAFDTLYNRFQR